MGQPLTSLEMLEEIREARANATTALEVARDRAAVWVRLNQRYELTYNSAFVEAKERGDTEGLAKARAAIAAADDKRAADQALEDKRLARLDSETWQTVLEALVANTHLINREIKLEQTA